MAHWTQTQAEAATVTRCDKVSNGGTYKHRVIRVSHDSFMSEEWIDTDLAENATAADVKNAIVSYLTSHNKRNKPTRDVFEDEGVSGTIVSDLS